MSGRGKACWLVLLVCLCVSPHAAGELQDKPVDLPPMLVEAGLVVEPGAGQAGRTSMTWAQVLAEVEPAPWPVVEGLRPGGVLPAGAQRLVDQAAEVQGKGEAYRATQLLHEAEAIAPDHPTVVRALGLAYAESGNLARAAAYLTQAVANRRDDAEALLLLARHAAQRGDLASALTYSQALDQTDTPKLLANLYRSRALQKAGYWAAAAERMLEVHRSLDLIPAEDAAQAALLKAPLVLRELRVVKAIEPELLLEYGDLLLASGQTAQAQRVFVDIKLTDPVSRQSLTARRVYLALRAGETDLAIDLVAMLLGEADATAGDARLAGYLLSQGVEVEALAQRLESVIVAEGVSYPVLVGLSQAADNGRLLAPIKDWLGAEALSPKRLSQAVGLLTLDDGRPEDADLLAQLLLGIEQQMAAMPEQSLMHARAVVEPLGATPVTLLRAVRSVVFRFEPSVYRDLISAAAYEKTGRLLDAEASYTQVYLSGAEVQAEQVRLPLVRLKITLGQGEQALELLGPAGEDMAIQRFVLLVRAMAAAGRFEAAMSLVDARLEAGEGGPRGLALLRLELIAAAGEPVPACNQLIRLIRVNPQAVSLYEMGFRLISQYQGLFPSDAEADRMRKSFEREAVLNLPDSTLGRIALARIIRDDLFEQEWAEVGRLLHAVLKDEPENREALQMLVEFYDRLGTAEGAARAQAIHERYLQTLPAGLSRVRIEAGRALQVGDAARAARVIDQALALDEQGVLPGRAMNGAVAVVLLGQLEQAAPQRDMDGLYLSMVERFPEHAGLNNSLGYRWALEGKNLRQAKEMIERANEADPGSHAILDSLAWVQYKLGDFEAARATQARALMVLEAAKALSRQRGPAEGLAGAIAQYGASTAVFNDHMGDILYQLGQVEEAAEHWRAALKQWYPDELKVGDPELASLDERVAAKLAALEAGEAVPVSAVGGE